jgi:glycerol-3-phosphate cytidylyltransferase-like family protein
MHNDKNKNIKTAAGGWIKYVVGGLFVLGSVTAVALTQCAGNVVQANACSVVHSSQGVAQAQQIEWLNLKTENKFVISYHVVEKRDKTISVLIKQKLDNKNSLAEVIESLRYNDQVYGSYSNSDYATVYKDYNYSIYAEDIDCSDRKHTVKSETRYNRYDNIIVTNTYNLTYDISETEPLDRLYRKYCS